ncbi:MAG: endo-1,4-beta-xylanase [Thermoguttaceae bacterium]|jgi:hypothetical protein
MGVMRFLVSAPERITNETLDQAYLCSADRTAWPVRVHVDGEMLTLQRDVSDSASLNIPWQVEGHGLLALSSATLLEQADAYRLPLELARGTISQLRNQLGDWQAIGLTVPPQVTAKIGEAVGRFSSAVVDQGEPQSAVAAQEALQAALDAGQLLANSYAEQAIAVRRRSGKLTSLLGGDLGTAPWDEAAGKQFLTAFNAALVPISWRDVEVSEGVFSWTICDNHIRWCRDNGLRVCAGPLLHFDTRSLPDWLCLWEDDFDNLLASVSEFVRAAIERYRGKVDLWLCAARVNTAEVLSLSEEEKLRLAARTIQLAQVIDPGTPTILSMEQPWGEYMSRREVDFPPLHFADALVRAGLDLRALMLETNVGCFRGGTLPRSALEFSRQIDYWSLLGLPLFLSLNVPSSGQTDPLAVRQQDLPAENWTSQSQQAWVARYVPLLLAKANVHGVFWHQIRDAQPHDFPHSGLFDGQNQAKPALKTLAAIRQTHLK